MAKADKKTEEYLAFGSVFRNLRHSKGFNLDEAARKVTTGAQISKFENGKLMPKATTFYIMLQNINVTMSEFQYEYNEYLHTTDVLLYSTEISTAYMTHNVAKLKAILEQLDEVIQTKKEIKKYKLDKIRVEAVLFLIDPALRVPKTDIDFLKNYLLSLKEWGQYDILLLEYTTTLFDLGTLSKLASRMLDPMQLIQKFPPTERATIQTLLNIIEIFVKNNQFLNANKYINYLEKSDIHDFYMSEKLMLVYYKAYLTYKGGDKSALDTMKLCQKSCEFCNCFRMANVLEQEIAALENSREKQRATVK